MRVVFKRTGARKFDVDIERVGPGLPERQLKAEDMLVPTPSTKDKDWHPVGTDRDAPRVR